MTLDNLPHIGKYSSATPNLYVALSFNKWETTSSMASAMILSDIVQEKKKPYAEAFSPPRTILRPQLVTDIFEAIKLLSFSKKRCPHMSCTLKWNPIYHSWDCPCHGSRFSKTELRLTTRQSVIRSKSTN